MNDDFTDEYVDDNNYYPGMHDDFQVEDETLEEKRERKEGKRKKKLSFIILFFVALILVLVAAFAGYSAYQNDKAPVVTTVHIESDNFDGHGLAVYGNMITLSFSFNKEISNVPTVTIQNKKVEVFGSGKNFYAKYFVQTQTDEDQEVQFMIYDYKDDFQKKGGPVTKTTDSSKVIILKG